MLDENIRYDIADAVLNICDDPVDCYIKANAISKSIKAAWMPGVVATADRVKRLAVNAVRGNVIESDFASDLERDLYNLYLDVNGASSAAQAKGDHEGALHEFSRLTAPVEGFFNKIMVMDKDEKLRTNRLALLKSIDRMYLEFADFSKIVTR
jgi:glycyl-tRNA synthetase beta chain